MKALLDANTLIAAFDQSHVDHSRANRFLAQVREFYTTPQTQGAFLRFFSRPWTDAQGQRREPRMTTATTMARLKAILALPKHRFMPDDLSFDKISMRSLSGFKQWNDAYLIALASSHRVKLATLDRKLENMDNASSPVVQKV
jgi:uncharacterized protein